MERELYSKIIYFEDYSNKDIFDFEVEKEYKRIKQEYADCVATKEFYKGNNIKSKRVFLFIIMFK